MMKITALTQNIRGGVNVPRFEPVSLHDWRNGLIVRMPNHLGDAVMALPALLQLKKIIPEHCGLFVITPAPLAHLYLSLPEIGEVVSLKSPHRFWSSEERKQVRQLRPGIALLFNHSLRDAIDLRLARVPQLYGAAARGRSLILTRAFAFPKRIPGDPAGSHQATRYLALAQALGAPEWNGELPCFAPPVAVDELRHDLTPLCRHPQLLLLAAGAAYGAAKRWPQENFAAVGRYWIRHGGIVAVLGSGAERQIGADICAALPQGKCVNLCGKTGIFSLIHLFRNAAFTVANDSGLMHLGAILGAPGIVPFGPTDFLDTGPLTSRWIILHDEVDCAPCLKHSCPAKERACMKNLTAARVIRELKKQVAALNIPFRRTPRHFC